MPGEPIAGKRGVRVVLVEQERDVADVGDVGLSPSAEGVAVAGPGRGEDVDAVHLQRRSAGTRRGGEDHAGEGLVQRCEPGGGRWVRDGRIGRRADRTDEPLTPWPGPVLSRMTLGRDVRPRLARREVGVADTDAAPTTANASAGGHDGQMPPFAHAPPTVAPSRRQGLSWRTVALPGPMTAPPSAARSTGRRAPSPRCSSDCLATDVPAAPHWDDVRQGVSRFLGTGGRLLDARLPVAAPAVDEHQQEWRFDELLLDVPTTFGSSPNDDGERGGDGRTGA